LLYFKHVDGILKGLSIKYEVTISFYFVWTESIHYRCPWNGLWGGKNESKIALL